jgi:hypothetical protein
MVRRSSMLSLALVLLVVALIPAHTRAQRPPVVAIQAGHWLTEQHADEFYWLRTSTGAVAGGVREVDLNVDVAHRIAEYLRSWGNEAYVLPSKVPPSYRADAFVAIHSDGNNNRQARGFKVATYYRDWIATDTLVRELVDEYAKQTGMPLDHRITANMRGYYAFNSGLYEHTIAEDTPGAIFEMGFLSNAQDRAFMIQNRDLIARSIALGIARFLGAKPVTGWPEPPRIPRGDVVEVLRDNVPAFRGPSEGTERVDRVYTRQRFAVAERQPGWVKLFSYSGEERWIQDQFTRQIVVPMDP